VKALSSHKLKPFQYELIKKLTRERYQQEIKSFKLKRNGDSPSRGSRHSPYDVKPSSLDRYSKFMHEYKSPSPPPAKRVKREHRDAPKGNNSGAALQSALYKALNLNHPYLCALSESNSSDSEAAPLTPDFTFQSPDKRSHSGTDDEDIERKIYDGLFKYENTRIGDTLKDIIVKTISEKVKCKLESTDFSGLLGSTSQEKQKAKESLLSAFSVPEHPTPSKRSRKDGSRSSSNAGKLSSPPSTSSSASVGISGNNQSSPTKKTRPKRGQYRKYNSQLLTEAVKAVQRGEMSVHRAGSYYGVPHSTLEYKVKERHLLRQKKIKEQQELKQKEAEEAAKKREDDEENSVSSSDREQSPSKKTAEKELSTSSAIKSDSPTTWTLPNSSASVYENAASLGLFATGFNINTPASELLRKLQHKVQSKYDDSSDDSDEGGADSEEIQAFAGL